MDLRFQGSFTFLTPVIPPSKRAPGEENITEKIRVAMNQAVTQQRSKQPGSWTYESIPSPDNSMSLNKVTVGNYNDDVIRGVLNTNPATLYLYERNNEQKDHFFMARDMGLNE
ncbi:MAG: hypothetical protein K2X66_10815 [Cyanobacteria bacterium]|nr:hypothetical protein [Cyanobacteriota bacterium]